MALLRHSIAHTRFESVHDADVVSKIRLQVHDDPHSETYRQIRAVEMTNTFNEGNDRHEVRFVATLPVEGLETFARKLAETVLMEMDNP